MNWLRKKNVRTGAEAALVTSAALPNSGSDSVDNSEGSSAAVSELISGLDFVLDEWDCEAPFHDQLDLQMLQLRRAVASYSNSKIPDALGQRWICPASDADYVILSAICSAAVYKPKDPIPPAVIAPVSLCYSEPSADAIKKAFGIWYFNTSPTSPGTLIVAVRGTKLRRDHSVNLNGDGQEVGDFITSSGGVNTPLSAHAGFLHGAKALAPKLQQQMAQYISDSSRPINNVIFTGHSAGAAVSSLLFLHFLTNLRVARLSSAPLKLSLITFGCPPTISTPIPSSLPIHTTTSSTTRIVIGQVLSFINEHDFVTRADAPYTSSLVDLFRSARAHAPTNRANGTTSAVATGLAEMGRYVTADIGGALPPLRWVLPPQQFFQIGDVVLLAKRRQAEQGVGLVTMAVGVEELQPWIFARLEVHHMAEYLERVRVIVGGTEG